MKKAIVLAVLTIAAVCVAQAQDATGDWIGTLETGMGGLRIVLHITKSPDGALKATMDSPDQGIGGMNVDTITLDGSKLKFTVNVVRGTYEGTLKNASTIAGNWTQSQKKPLEFRKTTTPPKLEHPPAPPSDIDGVWEGMLETPSQGKLRVTFHIKNTGDGLTATLDSPDQNIKGWPATSVARKGSSIKIEMAQIGGTFQGKVNKDLSIIGGDWSQGPNYPLTLRRTKEESPESKTPAVNSSPAHN
jgi:hypothetical protein